MYQCLYFLSMSASISKERDKKVIENRRKKRNIDGLILSEEFIMSKRSRKVSSIIQSESEDLRIKAANGINPSLRAGEDEMSQLN